MSCNNKTITIYQGFGTRWDDQDLLTVTFKSDVDIDGFGAEFLIGNIKKTYENIQDGFGINLTAQETATLPLGPNTGTLVIVDTENNKRPFSTELPFMVKDWAEGDIKLDGFDVTIDAKIQDNLLVINIESARAGDVEPIIDRKISEHNSSEQAHPYIRGLISAEEEARISADEILQGNIDSEETARKQADQTLQGNIDTVSASIKNGTLTIQKNGTTVQTFSANQSSNVTANLIIPTKTSDITNDSDFATNSGVSTAISNHNTSESAHSYIQGLISSEENRAKGVEGALTSLTTDTKTNLVSAINEVDSHTDTNTSSIGTLSNLTTEAKTNLVGAINEVDSHADTNANNIGTLTSLTTDAKTNLVSAINEVDSHTDTNTSSIGTMSSLTTDVKTTLVGAINEVDSHTDTNTNNIGTLTSLTTTDKTNLVSAINEVNGAISSEVTRAKGVEGTLTNLTTDSKTNLVSAINEVDSHTDTNTSNIGTLTSLTTDAQSNLVDAINEVDSHADTNASSIGTLTSLTTDAKTNLVSAINEIDSHADTNASDIEEINDLIPDEATPTNQLADKEFVNSSIATNTANFIGTFNSVSSLEGYSGTVTNNDYAFVINGVVTDNGNDWATFADLDAYDKNLLTNFDYAWVVNGSNFDLYRFDIVEQEWDLRVSDTQKSDVTLNTAYNRYKATVSGNVVTWAYEYTLNNSSFTAAQWASINSGATPTLIDQITTNENSIGTLSSLTTTAKTDLVSAINELDTDKVEANTAITGATKCKITYDSKGLVTGGANLEASDIPSLTLSKISDVSATASEVNVLDGITASTAELNILDGVTANATEINVLDGITASTSELNVLDGITATTTELNYVDGVTSSIQTQLDGKVPTARTINNKALTSDITLDASDVGALPDSTVIGDATLTIQTNGTDVATFKANATTNQTANIIVPTQASDVNALPDSTKYGADLSLTSGTLQLLDQDGNNLGNSVIVPDASNFANTSLNNLNATGKGIIDGKANTSLNNLDATGQAVIDDKASLTVNNTFTNTNTYEGNSIYKGNFTDGVAPSTAQDFGVHSYTDKDGVQSFYTKGYAGTDGTIIYEIGGNFGSGSWSNLFSVGRKNNAWHTFAKESDANYSILTTINKSKSGNGYFKLGNGMIVQWGNVTGSGNSRSVTYPTAFSNTDYKFVAMFSNSTQPGRTIAYDSTTTTGCKLHLDSNSGMNISYIAIGY